MRLPFVLFLFVLTSCGTSEIERKTSNCKAMVYKDFNEMREDRGILYQNLEYEETILANGYKEKQTRNCLYKDSNGRCIEYEIAYIPIDYNEQRKVVAKAKKEYEEVEVSLTRLKKLADTNFGLLCNYQEKELRKKWLELVNKEIEARAMILQARRDGNTAEEARLLNEYNLLEQETHKIDLQIEELNKK